MHSPPIPPVVSEPGNLSIKFSISRWDLYQCRLWVISQNWSLVGLCLFFSVGPAILNLNTPEIAGRSIGFKVLYFLIFSSFMLGIMACLQLAVHGAWAFFGKNQGVLGEHEVELRDDALVERCDVNESTHRWSGFRKMRSVGGFIFLYVGGNIVYYVPLRSFPSPAAADHFKNEIRRHAQPAQ